MAAPYAKVFERDESGYINTEQAVNVFIAAQAPCGPVGTKLVSNSKTFYKKYTPDGKYKSGYPAAFLNAEAVFNIDSPIYFRRVVPEDALYGGAVVTIGNQVSSYSLAAGLSSPDAFVFADVLDNATNETVTVSCKADVNGSLGATFFYLPNDKQFVYIKNNARKEVATVTCQADVTGSLNSTYFVLPKQGFYVWFNVDNAGVDPGDTALTLLNKTGIEINISANTTAAEVATAVVTALANNADVTCTAESNVLTITAKQAGAISHGSSGTSGFSYLTTILGINESAKVEISGLEGLEALIDAGASAAQVAQAVTAAVANSGSFTAEASVEVVTITAVTTGFMNDARDGENGTGFVFTTVTQGSSESGSEALLFYTADPNELDISFKIYAHQDHPEIATEEGTFVVEVYKDNVLETSITCSRYQNLKDGNGQPLYVETAMEQSAYLRCRDNAAVAEDEMPASITSALRVGGGSAGSTVTTGDMINAVQEWANKDDFDITLILVGGWTDPAYVNALNQLAKTRGDCCVINSIPYYVENVSEYLDNIIKYRKNNLNINSSYAATFSSSLQVFNSGLNKNVYIPSDGHIAGAIINASRNYEIFYPILGFKRGTLDNVIDVKHRYTREEMDALYDVQINPIRFIPGRGIVIWGQKTMQAQASALDRLNARLLLCSIKPQLQRFLEENIGELNTPQVRDAITLKLNGLFDSIKAKQGILDYKVTCDPLDPNAPNKLVVTVKIQITPAIEYAELTIVLTPAGVTFS